MKELRKKNIARDKEWNSSGDKVSLAFRGVELAGEVGELCNLIKKMERERFGIFGGSTDIEAIKDELADIIICTDLIAMDLGINLDLEVRKKFNKASVKYGFKTLMELEGTHD